MPKKQEKSSKVSTLSTTKKQRSFPEVSEWAAATTTAAAATEEKPPRKKQGGRSRGQGSEQSIAPDHPEPNLVVHRHYDSAHSHEQETADVGVSSQFFITFTQTLLPFLFNCRNLANHLYSKVYETQEDLCRKRNEIRLANLQLASVRAQVSVCIGRLQIKLLLPLCQSFFGNMFSFLIEALKGIISVISEIWKRMLSIINCKDYDSSMLPSST